MMILSTVVISFYHLSQSMGDSLLGAELNFQLLL